MRKELLLQTRRKRETKNQILSSLLLYVIKENQDLLVALESTRQNIDTAAQPAGEIGNISDGYQKTFVENFCRKRKEQQEKKWDPFGRKLVWYKRTERRRGVSVEFSAFLPRHAVPCIYIYIEKEQQIGYNMMPDPLVVSPLLSTY